MGISCSNPNSRIKATGLSGIYDVSQINKGVLLMHSQELTNQMINESILQYQAKLLKTPEDFLSNLHLGVCLFKQGFFDIAESHLLKSLKVNETYTAYYLLGLIYLQKNHNDQALKYFDNTITQNRDFIAAYLKSAETHLKLGDLPKAKELLKASLKIDRKNLEIYTLLGIYYKAKNKLPTAKTYFERALKGNTDCGKCFFYIGEIQHSQGLLIEAGKSYQNAVINSKGGFVGVIKISQALLYLDMERFDLVIKCAREALQHGLSISSFIASKGFGVIVKSTELLSAIRKYTKCLYLDVIKELKPIFRQDRSNALAGFFLALSYKNLKNYEKSNHYFKRIIKCAHIQASALSKILSAKAEREIETFNDIKKTEMTFVEFEEEGEESFDFHESPTLPKKQIPEFLISYHNFTTMTEPSLIKRFSFSEEGNENKEIIVHRSVTPPRPLLSKLLNDKKSNNEGCAIY